MPTFKWFAQFFLAATVASGLSAETNCPGNVDSVRYRLVNRHQMILPVSINHSGPYEFLLDTGTQITMLDPALAAELHLNTGGKAEMLNVDIHASALLGRLDLIEVGSHSVSKPRVLVYDVKNLPVSDLPVRGVLGEDFLKHFDMLLDNAHKLLCLDDTGRLRSTVKGAHIPLIAAAENSDGESVPAPLVISARLSDGIRPVRLELDSGSNTPFLYNADECLNLGLARRAPFAGGGANAAGRYYSALPPQTIKLGPVEITGVTFVTVNDTHKDRRIADLDGLLPLGIFRRILIAHTDQFVILELW